MCLPVCDCLGLKPTSRVPQPTARALHLVLIVPLTRGLLSKSPQQPLLTLPQLHSLCPQLRLGPGSPDRHLHNHTGSLPIYRKPCTSVKTENYFTLFYFLTFFFFARRKKFVISPCLPDLFLFTLLLFQFFFFLPLLHHALFIIHRFTFNSLLINCILVTHYYPQCHTRHVGG